MKSRLKIIALLFPIIFLSCGELKKNSEEAIPNITPQITVNNQGVTIDHNIYGSGEYTLLFVHGWCINQSYWDEQIKFLQSEYRIITIDLPGFGESGKNRDSWSIEKFGEDVNAIIDQLNLDNVILIGHSMGANIVLESALNNNEVIALIAIDKFKDVGVEYSKEVIDQINGFVEVLKVNFSEIAPAHAEATLFVPSTDSLVKVRVMNDFKNCDSVSAISSIEALIRDSEKESSKLQRLNQKIYFINSNASQTFITGLDETGVNYEIVYIDSTGHYPMIEKPEQFNNLLKKAIMDIEMVANN